MEGIILEVNQTEGLIRDQQGQRHRFVRNQWQSAEPPQRGDRVDFLLTGGEATQIYLLERASHTTASANATTNTSSAATSSSAPTMSQGTRPETSIMAIVSLVFGILGLIGLFFIGSLLGVIFGHLARAEIRRSAGRLDGDGMALVGLVLGYLGLLFILLVILFVFGIFVFAGVASHW